MASRKPPKPADRRSVETYLGALVGAEPEGGFVELRRRHGHGMRQEFVPVTRLPEAAQTILELAPLGDLYVGVAPRRRRSGGRKAIERVHVVWVDADRDEAMNAVHAFRPRPSIVISSGAGLHAYWALWPPIGPDEAEGANRRLAHALLADPKAVDAARILRPPGSLNFKEATPRRVEMLRCEAEVFQVGDIVGGLPGPPARRRSGDGELPRRDDPLDSISPAAYFEALAGLTPGTDGKVRCPLHDDHTPSLHVYGEPERGWYCYGCGRGGTLIDLAAALSGRGTRGADYVEARMWAIRRLLRVEPSQ